MNACGLAWARAMTFAAIFLDDERDPADVTWLALPKADFVIVRDYESFCAHIVRHGIPSFIAFDNDLGDGIPEGRDCAKWLVERVLDGEAEFPSDFQFEVHSKNPPAAQFIRQYLNSFLQSMDHPNFAR